MVILPFCDIFSCDEFNNKFNLRDFYHVQELTLISQSTVSPAQCIVSLLGTKSQSPKNLMNNSTIKSKTEIVLNELRTRKVSQTFRADLAVHTFAKRDNCIRQVFSISFSDRKYSIILLNVGSYIQRALRPITRASPLNPDRLPTVFEVIIYFYCENMDTIATE